MAQKDEHEVMGSLFALFWLILMGSIFFYGTIKHFETEDLRRHEEFMEMKEKALKEIEDRHRPVMDMDLI